MFSRALYELLSKMLDHLDSNEEERYTQHSRTNNKLDRVIELLENDSHVVIRSNRYGSGGVRLKVLSRKQYKPVQPHPIGKQKITLDIDTTKAAQKIERLKEELSKPIDKSHVPHIRIDIDDINDIPKVYVDGKDVTDAEHELEELHVT